jgi:hypothetical protein
MRPGRSELMPVISVAGMTEPRLSSNGETLADDAIGQISEFFQILIEEFLLGILAVWINSAHQFPLARLRRADRNLTGPCPVRLGRVASAGSACSDPPFRSIWTAIGES